MKYALITSMLILATSTTYAAGKKKKRKVKRKYSKSRMLKTKIKHKKRQNFAISLRKDLQPEVVATLKIKETRAAGEYSVSNNDLTSTALAFAYKGDNTGKLSFDIGGSLSVIDSTDKAQQLDTINQLKLEGNLLFPSMGIVDLYAGLNASKFIKGEEMLVESDVGAGYQLGAQFKIARNFKIDLRHWESNNLYKTKLFKTDVEIETKFKSTSIGLMAIF